MDLGRQGAAERDRAEEGISAGEREAECEMFKRPGSAGSCGGSSVSSIVRGTEHGGRERAIVNGVRASFCQSVLQAKLYSEFRLPGLLLAYPELRLCLAGPVS